MAANKWKAVVQIPDELLDHVPEELFSIIGGALEIQMSWPSMGSSVREHTLRLDTGKVALEAHMVGQQDDGGGIYTFQVHAVEPSTANWDPGDGFGHHG